MQAKIIRLTSSNDGSTRFSGMKPVNLWYHKERIVLDGVPAIWKHHKESSTMGLTTGRKKH